MAISKRVEINTQTLHSRLLKNGDNKRTDAILEEINKTNWTNEGISKSYRQWIVKYGENITFQNIEGIIYIEV